jgi:excisionase family DNA binding protein
MSKDELIGLAQAAQEFEIGHSTLRKAAMSGSLKAEKIANVWLVKRSEVRRYLEEDKPKMGRPLKEG